MAWQSSLHGIGRPAHAEPGSRWQDGGVHLLDGEWQETSSDTPLSHHLIPGETGSDTTLNGPC
eukprot:7861147-Prorocentrum_lima.AAC.1